MSKTEPTHREATSGDSLPETARRVGEHPGDHARLDAIMAHAPHENFPVALSILPGRYRTHLRAIYGYARLVDNLGDEYPGNRTGALNWLESQLDALFAGADSHPVLRRLAPTVAQFGLSRTPFDQLLAANRWDQRRAGYANWNELMEYCELSANPVGHLVLSVFESATPDRLAASDAVCSGLQVLEHLQDVGEDARAGRVYLPADDLERFGCTIEDLTAANTSPGLRRVVERQAIRAAEMMNKGRWLVGSLRGWARVAVSGYVAGGLSGLAALKTCEYNVLPSARPAGSVAVLRRYLPLYLRSALRRSGN